MTSITSRTPGDVNPLQPTKFLLSFSRIPTIQYFCQKVNLPGINGTSAPFENMIKDLRVAGTKIEYGDLVVDFMLDEALAGWLELHTWFRSFAAPTGFTERNRLSALQESFVKNTTKRPYSDATLVILNNVNIPTLRVNFYDVFPVSLSSVQFDTESSAENILTGSGHFHYDYYDFQTA